MTHDLQAFLDAVKVCEEEIKTTATNYELAKRNKVATVKSLASELLGIKPGDDVYAFPTQSFPREMLRVEMIEYWGQSPDGEPLFALTGPKLVASGAPGKRKIGTSVFPLSLAHTYKTRNG